MTGIEIFLYITGGVIGLFLGAEGLVRGSSSLALKLGISPLVVGLTVVAFATSSPELVVSVKAAINGNPGIVIGNVVGSNICNIALILGAAALISPMKIKSQVVKREIPIMIFVSIILLLILIDGMISTIEGIFLIAGIISYIYIGYRFSLKEKSVEVDSEFKVGVPKQTRSIWLSLLMIAIGLGLLVGGAHIFVNGAVEIAIDLGVNQAVIGLTMVALGTSLPELITSIVASFRHENDIAIGNAVGSNVFNILSILGFSSVIRPIDTSGVGMFDLGIMMFFTVIILPLSRSGSTLRRREGALLLFGYVFYIVYLVFQTF